MAKITIKGKVFHAIPQWEEYLEDTDFTSTERKPYLHRYYIDDVEVTKDDFENQYKAILND